MSQNVTLSSATAAGGSAGAAVVVLDWLLPVSHQMPPDVAAALMVLLAPTLHVVGSLVMHWLAKRGVAIDAPVPATPAK